MNKKIAIITISMVALLITSCTFSYFRGTYAINFIEPTIIIATVENGNELAKNNHESNILTNSLIISEEVKPNKKYNESISFINKGGMPSYVRATVYRYWCDENGIKKPWREENGVFKYDLLESNIIIEFNTIDPLDGPNNGVEGWFEIRSMDTVESTLLAYNYQLDPETGITPDLIKSIKIDDQVLTAASYDVDPDTGEVTTTYGYDDLYFCVEVAVDAIQAYHNENQNVNTFRSLWGWTPIFQDGYLIGIE